MAARNFSLPGNRAFNSNGLSVPGATATLYTTGTSTEVAGFFSDSGLSVSLGATITANGAGRFADAYGDNATPYRLIVKDRTGATQDDIDPFYFGQTLIAAGGTSSYATRTALAAVPASSGAVAKLLESGREGDFVFSSSNLSSNVTADTQQGLYVAPASDTTGASGAWVRKFTGPIDADWFGAVGNGTTDDTTALQKAVDFVGFIGGGIARLTPGKSYKVSTITASSADVSIDARGATVTSASTSSAATLYLSGSRVKVIGGTWKLTGASGNPWHFDVSGTDCEINGPRLVKTPDAGGYQAYFRHTGDGLKVRNLRAEGSNGFYVECSNSQFDGLTIIGRSTGGDDGLAIKALNDSCRNVTISNIYAENLSSTVSIGSEIGTAGAADSTYSKTAGQIDISNITAKNCYGLLFIKPGGVGSVDVRDGTVEGVVASNLSLIDESGTKCERPIAIVAGRGARIRNISVRDVKVRARTAGGAGRLIGADVYITSDVGGTAASSISGVEINGQIYDNYAGAANDGSHPGYPFASIASVNRAGGTGSFSDIVLDIRGDGSSEAGFVVGSGITSGAVRVKRMHLTNVNVSNAAGQGGAHVLSLVQMGSDAYWSVTAAAGTELSATSVGFTSQIYSKDSGVSAQGAAEVLPTVPNATIDVNGTAARLVSYQTGIGYRDLQLEAANIVWNPSGSSVGTVSSTGLNLVSGKVFQINSVTLINGSGVLQAAAFPALTGDVTTVAGSLATTVTTGTSGTAIPRLSGANSWGALQTFANGKIAVSSAGLAQIDVRDSTNGGGTIKFRNAADSASHALIVVNNTPTMTFQCDNYSIGDTALANTFITASASAIALKAANATVANITSTGVAITGNVSATTSIFSSGATSGVGYTTGAGGTVTQLTSKTTGVTLSKVCGQFTTNNAALAAAALATFTVTNTNIAATDTINLNLQSGQATVGTYRYWIEKVAAGSFQVTIENRSAGSLSEALVFNFAALKAVAA